MRRITPAQIAAFFALLTVSSVLALFIVWKAYPMLSATRDFAAILALFVFVVLLYGFSIAIYRLFLRVYPLPQGEIPPHSRGEAIYHIHLLFFLLLFYPLMKSNLVPVPLMRVIYVALGARLGANTYSGGILFDPIFIDIGSNTIVGQSALLIPHVIEGERLAHFPIRIGDNVTIGANAVVLADVVIGSDAVIAIGSVVTKGTRIPAGETWGGTPARRLQRSVEIDQTQRG
jgi:acetyltransferase-like isoleucine patch superfamily enzyme